MCGVAIQILLVAISRSYCNEYFVVAITVKSLLRYFVMVAIVAHVATIITCCQ